MNHSNDALFSSDLWEKALEKFATAAHITVKLFDSDLRVVLGPIHPTPLFHLFDEKGYDHGLFAECVRRCLVQTHDRPTVIVSEFYGLAVVGTSLVLEGKIVGAAVGGYVFADFSQVSEIQRLARQAGLSFDQLWDIARQQQPVPHSRLIVHGELLQVLGDALLRENYRTRQYAETAAIVTSSDDAIFGEDLRGFVTSWNRGAEKLFGYPANEAIGHSLDATISSTHSGEGQAIRERVKRGEVVDHYETIRRRKDGTSPDVSLTVSPIKDARGRIVAVSTIARDITERKQAEKALRESQQRLTKELAATKQLQAASALLIQGGNSDILYQKIVEAAVEIMQSDMASMQIVDEHQDGLRLLAFQGFEPEFSKIFEWVLPNSRTACNSAKREERRVVVPDVEKCNFIAGTTALEEYRRIGVRAVQSTPLCSRDGHLLGVISTHWRTPHTPSESDLGQFDILARQAADLLERRESEEALQRAHDELEFLVERRTASLRRLSSRLQNVQDEERRRIARNLHDSAGQYLAAIKMNLALLKRGLSTTAAVEECEQLVDQCLAEIRTVSHLLHPPLLDESGLLSAATWYVEGFEKRSGIKVNLHVPADRERLPHTVEMALFRGLQEALTNVHRHSGSSKVDIGIEVQDGVAILSVRDYGRGLTPEQLETFERGIDLGVGLTGMRERVSELGGRFQIFAEKPGASVLAMIPIQKRAELTASEPPLKEHGSAA